MIYLKVDGMISGTGIRDAVEGGYYEPEELGVSDSLTQKINDWLERYEDAHYSQYQDEELIDELDTIGLEITALLKKELTDSKITYYSEGKNKEIFKHWMLDRNLD